MTLFRPGLRACEHLRHLSTNLVMASANSLNRDEVEKFRKMSDKWWDVSGPATGLHSMNDLRVPFVLDGLVKTGKGVAYGHEPLKGVKILDVGCGGGLLSEPLARLGAGVTGLDPCRENIEAARDHSGRDPDIRARIEYVCSTVEDFEPGHAFDAVVASEVVEHVDNPARFVADCAGKLAGSGSLFLTTINRTTRSWLGAIVGAEYVLRLLPAGTHDWNKFITPEELGKMVESAGCNVRLVHGMFYVPIINKWSWFPDTAVNYAIHAVKAAKEVALFTLAPRCFSLPPGGQKAKFVLSFRSPG